MSLVVYNSFSRKKEVFTPLHKKEVKMYVCGPTVYDLLHIGNFRGAVFYNLACQWLEHSGYKVCYIYNFTDIDDKILNRAKKENTSPKEISQKYIKEFQKDWQALKLRKHDKNPRATEFIPEMTSLIKVLCDSGKAYCVEGGDVFFHVPSFEGYGRLSGRTSVEDVLSGMRIEKDTRKKDIRDFALWKRALPDEPGWPSPWGRGRPGWHIECTTMIYALLGQSIDIHGGGSDLMFPHHENEIAQAEAFLSPSKTPTEKKPPLLRAREQGPFVKYWMHHNMFTFGGEKMAKSLGNLITMRSFLQKYGAEVFKFLVLSAHYRSPVSISEKSILQAISSLSRIYTFLKNTSLLSGHDFSKETSGDFKTDVFVKQALDDDFNTPRVLSLFFKGIRMFNEKQKNKTPPVDTNSLRLCILKYGKMMSLFQEDPACFLRDMDGIFLKIRGVKKEDVEALMHQRVQARKAGDFKKADDLREKLSRWQIDVKDLSDGRSYWECRREF